MRDEQIGVWIEETLEPLKNEAGEIERLRATIRALMEDRQAMRTGLMEFVKSMEEKNLL